MGHMNRNAGSPSSSQWAWISRSETSAVQRHREWATRLVQALQDLALQTVLGPTAHRRIRLLARAIERVPALRDLRAHVFAFGGLWPEELRA
jgi:hypothetical protein